MKLMGIEGPKDILPTSPSREEIAAYVDSHYGGPSVENFRPDFKSPATSSWNKRMSEVFVADFIARRGAAAQDKPTIEKGFRMYFRYLKEKTRWQRSDIPKVADRRNAHRNRRHKLLEYRIKGCRRFKQLDHLAQSIEQLGAEGMSDDESDKESGPLTGNRTYQILDIDWRSKDPKFLAFLELLDLLHMSTKFKRDGTPNPGNWPRVRVRLSKQSNYGRNIVPGLPENFYDKHWLEKLNANDPSVVERLEIQPAVDLAVDPRIAR